MDLTHKLREAILLAESPTTSAETLKFLAEADNVDIRISVAGNLKTPPESLNLLSEDSDMWVKLKLSHNIKLPTEAIIRLSVDKSAWVRSGIAGNNSTPVEVLKNMIEDDNWGVVDSIAGNPNTPHEILLSEKVLHNVSNVGAKNILSRRETTREQIMGIVYGDYPEHVVRTAASFLKDNENVKIFVKLKYGDKKEHTVDYDRFAV